MHLEAGLKKDDDNKFQRRSFGSSLSTNYVRYERWVKLIGFSSFACWTMFVLAYWGSTSSGRDAVGRESTISAQSSENAFPEETRFLIIGDYGTGDKSQIKVAEALKFHAVTLDPKPAFVLSTGDQIYEHGLVNANDPVLSTRFEKMYAHPVLQVPWYITIGNHDCEGSIDAMLGYASQRQSLWYFPQRYYKIDRPVAPKTVLRMVVLDACDLVCGHEPRNFRCKDSMNQQSSEKTRLEQYEWLEQQLSAGMPAGIERMWTVVVGHWAVYSYAGNADTPELISSLDPLLKKYKVHAYINGHDHCMQHMKRYDSESKWVMNYFVNGAGGYRVHDLKPKSRANPDLVHAAMTHGFMSVWLTRDIFRIQMIDTMGEVLYTTDVQYE